MRWLSVVQSDDLNAADFLAVLPAEGALAVACSGGADSLSAALLLRSWCGERKLYALVVDHALRPESAAQAHETVSWLARHGIEGHLLQGSGQEVPQSNIQAWARALRWRLMIAWCCAYGVGSVVTGHHQEDQAETVLLRLGRGSGLKGLRGMRVAEQVHPRVRVYRPFLRCPGAVLRGTLDRLKETAVVDDPSNRNPAFGRTVARGLLPDLDRIGVSAAGLAATAHRLDRDYRVTVDLIKRALQGALAYTPFGVVRLERRALMALPDSAVAWMCGEALQAVGGWPYPPRRGKTLEPLVWRMRKGESFHTLVNTVRLSFRRHDVLVFALRSGVSGGQILEDGAVWDGRFRISGGGRVCEVLSYERARAEGLPVDTLPVDVFPWPESVARLPKLVRRQLPVMVEDGKVALPAEESGALVHGGWRLTSRIPEISMLFGREDCIQEQKKL